MYMRLGTQTVGSFNKISILIGAAVGFMFGEWTPLLMGILTLQALDVITGLLVGGQDKNISSHQMREGIKKKVGTWIALVLAHVIDQSLFGDGGQAVILTATAFGMLAQEGVSIVENLGKIGIEVPVVTKYLIQVREYGERTAEIKLGKAPNIDVAGVEIIHTDGQTQTVVAEDVKTDIFKKV